MFFFRILVNIMNSGILNVHWNIVLLMTNDLMIIIIIIQVTIVRVGKKIKLYSFLWIHFVLEYIYSQL